ncbi:hypothetical protein JX265_009671 [Neoarthrinium moseri]|uniref:Uncharacterized protein n=1 Tax=Neoarthrinium moseri TaxID=1658444 RepID=A0A9Q0AL02_9PEZI|nr:uncharacterized protein JN550_010908 [Neoarthrinium moseri]KAI1861052.1 hypothetical protein JX265_009671 [Neoarthrinium moseri]KAI1861378.1 hypothetical protein JN550_010908 [Neoarthrinium moseri]
MSRRTVLSAVGGNGAVFEAAAARRIPQCMAAPQRSFSSTAQRNATQITHFKPASSPELDALLSTIRHQIIMPAYLTETQRKRLYSSRWEKRLAQDPIVMEVDGEVFRFRHLEPFKGGMVNTRKSIGQAVSQFSTDADWENLRPLLEGVHNAGRRLSDTFLVKLVRIVGEKGHADDLIECARGARRTGFRLDRPEKVNELLHYVQLKAVDAAWARPQTEQALRRAELVIELLQSDAHAPAEDAIVEGSLPLHRDPQVLMAPLHLAAALVVKGGVTDAKVVEKVDKLADTVVRLWPADTPLRKLYPIKEFLDEVQMGYLLQPSKFVAITTPLLHGLDLAAQAVSSPELAAQLRSRHQVLESDIQKALREVQSSNKASHRGKAVYNKFFGGA